MALSITATWLPTVYGYRLDAAGAVGAPVWYRSAYWSDGRFSNQTIGTGVQIHDLMVPLDGATVTYTAIDGADIAEATVAPPSIPTPVIGLIGYPEIAAAEVIVESSREQNVAGRPIFHDVLDRNEPFVETQRPIERTGQMTLRLTHTGGVFPGTMLTRLRAMLRFGGIMMLRTLCTDRVEDLVFVFTSWSEQQIGDGNEHGPSRKVVIDWRAVDPLWGAEISMSTRVWGMVPSEFPSWTAVVAGVPTWGDLP